MASTIKVQNLEGPTGGANANKIIVRAGHSITADAGSMYAPGQVIQTVHHKFFDVTTTTTTDTWVDCAGSVVDITPYFATSKLVFTMTYHAQGRDGEQHGVAPYYRIGSGGYSIISNSSTFNEVGRIANGGTIVWAMGAQTWELQLSSTDTVSFKMMQKTRYGGSVRINDNGPGSSFLIQEIAQ